MTTLREIEVLKIGDSTSADGVDTFHTKDDLLELANSYQPNLHEAPVILGHDSDKDWSKLLSSDKEPAYGWIKGFKVKNNALFADVDASDELIEFIDKKRYKKRSLAYYSKDSKHNPKKGKIYVRHLAMLGASPPAIKGLKDIKLAEEDKKMATKEEAVQLLNENAKEWLAFILKDNGNIVNDTIVAFDPEPSEENNWLYNPDEDKFEGAFINDREERFVFEINQSTKNTDDEGNPEFIVSVKADVSDETDEVEKEIVDEAQEVQDSLEETTDEAEQVAEENLEDQEENELREKKKYDEEDIRLSNKEDKLNPEDDKKMPNNPEDKLGLIDLALTEEDKKDCPKCEAEEEDKKIEKGEPEETLTEEDKEKEKMMAELTELREEVLMLREKVKLQEEKEFNEKIEGVKEFSEQVYKSGKILESQLSQEELTNILVGLASLKNEHMVYGEGDNQKDILESFKTVLNAIPEQVQYSEAVAERKPVATPKYDPKFSEESQRLDAAIRKSMKDAGYNQDNMVQYTRFYRELNGRV